MQTRSALLHSVLMACLRWEAPGRSEVGLLSTVLLCSQIAVRNGSNTAVTEDSSEITGSKSRRRRDAVGYNYGQRARHGTVARGRTEQAAQLEVPDSDDPDQMAEVIMANAAGAIVSHRIGCWRHSLRADA